MRLFFKHLLRSIKSRPTQPIIILTTLMLSVSVMVSVLTLHSAISEERYYMEEASVGRADIEISLSSKSASRFMFAEDVRQIVGEDCAVCGYYQVVLSAGDSGVYSAAAVDFKSVNSIFNIEFTDYIGVNEGNIGSCAFVSRDFARENKLSVGDSFESELFGKKKLYTVAGISNREFIKSFDVLLDISGVVKILASEFSFAAALGEDFRPCNTVLVDAPEGADIKGLIETLSDSEAFRDRSIEDVSQKGFGKSNSDMIGAIIKFSIVLCCIMTAVVCYSCFSILARERSEENYSFAAAGAKPSLLYFMQYAEGCLYWAVGSGLGLLLSLPLLTFIKKYVGFKYVLMNLTPSAALMSLSFLLASVLFSVSVFVFSGKNKRQRKIKGILLIASLTVCVLLYIAALLVPLKYRLAVGMTAAVLLLVFVFLSAEWVYVSLVGLIIKRREGRLLENGTLSSPSLHYALKNIHSLPVLHSIGRMLSLLVGAFLCISYTISSLNGNLYLVENLFESEYIVMNGTPRCLDKVEDLESVKNVERLYFVEAEYENGVRTNMISISDIDAFNDTIGVTHQPTGDEAVISYTEAKALSLEVGDSFVIKQNNLEIELRVAQIVKSGLVFVLFDCEHFGMDYTMLLPVGKEGYSSEEQLVRLSSALAEEVAAVVGSDKLAENISESAVIYLKSGNILLTATTIFSLIGIVNTLLECYRSRREELSMYSSAGMSKRKIRRLKLSEILLTVGFATVFGIIGFLVTAPIVNSTMLANCYDVYENFAAWLDGIFA